MDFNQVILTSFDRVKAIYPTAGFYESQGQLIKDDQGNYTSGVYFVYSLFRLDDDHLISCAKGVMKEMVDGKEVEKEYDYEIEVSETPFTSDKVSDPNIELQFTDFFAQVSQMFRVISPNVLLRASAYWEGTDPVYVVDITQK